MPVLSLALISSAMTTLVRGAQSMYQGLARRRNTGMQGERFVLGI